MLKWQCDVKDRMSRLVCFALLASVRAFVPHGAHLTTSRDACARSPLFARSDSDETTRGELTTKLAAFVIGGILALQPGAPPPMLPHAYAAKASSASTSAGSRVNKDAESLLR